MNELEQLRKLYDRSPSEFVHDMLEALVQENAYLIRLNLLHVFPYDERQVYLFCYEIKALLESEPFTIETFLHIPYNKNIITFVLKGKLQMEHSKKLNFVIPYGYREEYIDFMYDVTQVEETEVTLFVNNIPYVLECFLYVETEQVEIVRQIALRHNVQEFFNGKTLEHYFSEQKTRQWNCIGLNAVMGKDRICDAMKSITYFPTVKELEAEGYSTERNYQKVFISYSHKDEEKVLDLERRLIENGIPVWRDTYDIRFGESLTEKISAAMQQSSVFLLCLSQHTKHSLYAKQETETLYNQVLVYRSKGKVVVPIKLDDVDPDDIIFGLKNFKYCDYAKEEEVNQLLTQLMRATRAFQKDTGRGMFPHF